MHTATVPACLPARREPYDEAYTKDTIRAVFTVRGSIATASRARTTASYSKNWRPWRQDGEARVGRGVFAGVRVDGIRSGAGGACWIAAGAWCMGGLMETWRRCGARTKDTWGRGFPWTCACVPR
jgi:hypothetical protein